jgi:hypothetical protein
MEGVPTLRTYGSAGARPSNLRQLTKQLVNGCLTGHLDTRCAGVIFAQVHLVHLSIDDDGVVHHCGFRAMITGSERCGHDSESKRSAQSGWPSIS